MKNGIKSTFFSSDWHIGHKNILTYSNRPFKDIDEMAEALIRRYNAIVPEDGICYFLGDMGFTSGDAIKKVVDQLRGTKVLILGNHDKHMNGMYNAGFDAVMYGAKLVIANEIVTLSHCPLFGVPREDTSNMKGSATGENWHGESRENHKKFMFKDEGQFSLHGHIHSPNGGKSQRILNKQFDVGVDANKYTPVSISQIESWIVNYKNKQNDTQTT